MKLKYIIASLSLLSPLTAQAVTVAAENLGGLLTPTGSATNGGDTRQYTWTTGGGEVTILYTLVIVMPSVDLTTAFAADDIFRRPGATANDMIAGDNFTIKLNSITANSGWTLNSVTTTASVGVGGSSRVGDEIVKFSVIDNDAPTSPFSVTTGIIDPAPGGVATVTNADFALFNEALESLFFEADETNSGKVNLTDIKFSFDVTAVPEPSSSALFGLGCLALILRRRR